MGLFLSGNNFDIDLNEKSLTDGYNFSHYDYNYDENSFYAWETR